MNKIQTQFLAFLALMLMGTSANVYASPYIRIGGTDVTSANASDVFGNGQFKYDISTKTLTVTNATLTSHDHSIYNGWTDGLIINLVGSSTFKSDGSTFCSSRPFSITGSGTLYSSGEHALHLAGGSYLADCTINGPRLFMKSTLQAVYDNVMNSTLKVENTSTRLWLSPNSSYGYRLNAFSLGSGLYITQPYKGYFNSSKRIFTTDGTTEYKGDMLISSRESQTETWYGLYVGETRVTNYNCDDVFRDGQFQYYPGSKALYVRNANLSNSGSIGNGIDNRSVDGLAIYLVGTSNITTRNSPIASAMSFSINGSGTLNGKSTASSGINLWGDGITCTVDGPKVNITGTSYGVSDYYKNATLKVQGSSTSLNLEPGSGYAAVNNLGGLTLGSGQYITSPSGAFYSSSLKSITVDNKNGYKGKVVISSTKPAALMYIGDTEVKSENYSDILGNGQFSYDPSTKTLNVWDANMTSDGVTGTCISNREIDGLTIYFSGTNNLTARNSVVYSNKPFTIDGSGVVNMTSNDSYGIALSGDANMKCTIDGPTININSKWNGMFDHNNSASLIVKGTRTSISVKAGSNYTAIRNLKDMTLQEDMCINEPLGGYYSSSLKSITANGSSAYYGNVAIGRAIDYGFLLGETVVTSANYKDVFGNGQFSYDPSTKTLTMKDATLNNIDGTLGNGIDIRSIEGLTIKVEGTNTINVRNSIIAVQKSFKMIGTGTLNGTSRDDWGLFVWNESGTNTGSVHCYFNGPSVTLNSAQAVVMDNYGIGTLEVEGNTTCLTLNPTYNTSTIYRIGNIILGSNVKITEPEGAYFSSSLKSITIDGENDVTGKVVIRSVESYGLFVADEQVTSLNAADILGDGHFSFDPTSNTLTMRNANLTKTDGYLGSGIDNRTVENLTIKIEGTNYIKTRNSIIGSIPSLSITGTGTLNGIAAGSEGMNLWNTEPMTCTINGPKINIQSFGGGLTDSYHTATLKVEGSTTSLTFQPITTDLKDWSTQPVDEYGFEDSFTIMGLKSLVMGSNVGIIEPQGGRFDSSLQGITTDGTTVFKGKVVIGADEDYGFYVSETRVKSSNADDILGDGCFSYDPATMTLTVRNANLENDGGFGTGISNREVDGLTINLVGNNVFKTRMAVIDSKQSINITGTGTLTGTSTTYNAFYFWGERMMCTIDGPTIDFTASKYAISDYYSGTTMYIVGKNTCVSLQSGNGNKTVHNLGYIGIDENLSITPNSVWFDRTLKSFTEDGTNAYTGKVVICGESSGEYFSEETADNVDVSYHVTGDNTVEVGAQNGNAVGDDATEVDIPETVGDYTVTGVAASAFEWNYGINTVYLPATIETIGYGAFFNCGNLYHVYLRSRQAPTLLDINGEPTEDNNAFAGLPMVMPGDPTTAARSLGNSATDDLLEGATLHVPDGCLDEYNKYPWIFWFSNIVTDATKHGDVNGDFTVDVADIATVIDVMATGVFTQDADVNKDGTVDVADIATVIDIMAANARRLKQMAEE